MLDETTSLRPAPAKAEAEEPEIGDGSKFAEASPELDDALARSETFAASMGRRLYAIGDEESIVGKLVWKHVVAGTHASVAVVDDQEGTYYQVVVPSADIAPIALGERISAQATDSEGVRITADPTSTLDQRLRPRF